MNKRGGHERAAALRAVARQVARVDGDELRADADVGGGEDDAELRVVEAPRDKGRAEDHADVEPVSELALELEHVAVAELRHDLSQGLE